MRDTALLKEFTGKEIRITFSADQKLCNLKGTIVSETRNVFKVLLHHNRKIITVPKKGIVFEMRLDKEPKEIKGNEITFDPVMRTKRIRVK